MLLIRQGCKSSSLSRNADAPQGSSEGAYIDRLFHKVIELSGPRIRRRLWTNFKNSSNFARTVRSWLEETTENTEAATQALSAEFVRLYVSTSTSAEIPESRDLHDFFRLIIKTTYDLSRCADFRNRLSSAAAGSEVGRRVTNMVMKLGQYLRATRQLVVLQGGRTVEYSPTFEFTSSKSRCPAV